MPTSYRTERAAQNLARRLRDYGKPAYVYRCEDCSFIPKDKKDISWADLAAGRVATPTVIPAWHVGIDTGAPHHTDRTRCEIPDYSDPAYWKYGA